MSPFNAVVSSLLLLLTVNAVFLDMIIFSRLPDKESAATVIAPAQSLDCPVSCQTLIDQKFVLPKAIQTPAPQNKTTKSAAKEYYVPLGSGTTRQTDYQELTSVEAYIDSANYPPIKEAYFEVHLRNPTGNGVAYAKLYNVTDKHDVWQSEISLVGGGTAQREGKITLDRGRKLYRVMIKATLQYDVYVDNARIRIVTQ